MPKRYLVFRWCVYALATLLLSFFQLLVTDHISLLGVIPFLPPMVVGVVASYAGSRAGPVFALVYGLLCDLSGSPPAPGFFTLVFTLAALVAALMAERLFSPGFLCSLMATSVCYLLTALARLLLLAPDGSAGAGALLAAEEFLVSLPFLLVVFPVYRWVHRKTWIEY